MDILLAKVTQQAMTYAIRSGIAITSTYALKQCGRLMKTVNGREKEELAKLQLRLDSKIKIISPAIDMIELIAARGNTSLESAVTLTKSLRWDIQTLGSRVEKAVAEEQLSRRGSSKAKSRAQNDIELNIIISEMKQLLERIEDAVPLINLAITTSGVSLHTTLPATVSPSRLLQASTFLTAGDMQYCTSKPRAQQIGPTFTLSMYMLFSGYANRPHGESFRETTWKEVMHKARVTLLRVPLDKVYDYPTPFRQDKRRSDEANHRHIPSDSTVQEFAYQLLIVEDLDDGRMHDFEDGEPHPEPYDGIEQAGVREVVPIHEVSKIFYADTGKILNIGTEGETNNPILLLKRDLNAAPPRRMMERDAMETGYDSDDSHTVGGDEVDPEETELEDQLRRESTANLQEEPIQEPEITTFPWRLPPTLDLEWMAFEVFSEDPSTDSEFDETEDSELDLSSPTSAEHPVQRDPSESPAFLSRMSNLNLRPSTPSNDTSPPPPNTQLIPSPRKAYVPVPQYAPQAPTTLPPIKTSLSLLEMLIRLTALQQFQQSSHLAIPDEFLNFFLSDSSTVGAGGDSDLRRRVRREARMRVGFDPYDESPIKRRGEEYLEHELHEDHAYEATSPVDGSTYDYEGYPTGRASTINSHSRSGTPVQSPSSPSFPNSTPAVSRSISSNNVRLDRPSLSHLSSPSPLLRRATTQPNQNPNKSLRQPSFRGLPTAPPTSSSPRQAQPDPNVQAFRGSVAPDTPPSTVEKQA
ncbi:Ran-binding-domain-containing protein [Cucurbitaria berberidis CBS 394.84]|uniref:Ran-binding-domain-containing protein n=1 Tax=Cucurbitaria berberidis CBS 394.84 TaxID=1168544 RepID=A0A9P4LDQ3_9PLEO|nr:Ran-binding-domain-containing protein [Cucurbitaria berberidis CBS 394.84]KAF1850339.1 Ran-binding-domain-containing protein [Cucurbitaria berberidis CBS 394.84]